MAQDLSHVLALTPVAEPIPQLRLTPRQDEWTVELADA